MTMRAEAAPLPDALGSWRELPLDPRSTDDAPAALDPAARRPELIDVRCDVPRVLASLSVAVIGAGSIGQRVIDSLARMGIGALAICDGRSTKLESLLTHPIRPDEVGVQKALLAARRAKSLSPATRVRYFAGPFEAIPRDALADASWVVLCTDNLMAEVAVAQASRRVSVPLLQASVYGRALVAQLRVIANASEQGPCGPCGYTARDWADLDRDARYSCEGGAEPSPAPPRTAAPTASLPHLCSLAADLAIGELLRRALALDPGAAPDELVELRGYRGELLRTPLARRGDCPLDHGAWRVCVSDGPLESLTPRGAVRIAGYADAELPQLIFSVERHRFAAFDFCECGAHGQVTRFLPDGAKLPLCPHCHAQPVPHPLHTHAQVPGKLIDRCLDRQLGDLGVRSAPTLLIDGPRGATLLRAPQARGRA